MKDTDGLIDPDRFPVKSSQLDVDKIYRSAQACLGFGNTLGGTTAKIASQWSGLKSCYQAPEQEQVYAIMKPAASAGDDIKQRMTTAHAFLNQYGENVAIVRRKLADLEMRAIAFRMVALQTIKDTEAHKKSADYAQYRPWHLEPTMTARNGELLQEVGHIFEELAAYAEGTSGYLRGLLSESANSQLQKSFDKAETDQSKVHGPPAPPAWGWPREVPISSGEIFIQEVGSFIKDGWTLTLRLYGVDENGHWSPMTSIKTGGGILLGLADVAVYLGSLTPEGIVARAAVKKFAPTKVSNFLENRRASGADIVGGTVGLDLNGPDPFVNWKNDPWRMGIRTVLNLGSMAIPAGGGAGVMVRVATRTAAGARVARGLATVSHTIKEASRIHFPGGPGLMRIRPEVLHVPGLDTRKLAGVSTHITSEISDIVPPNSKGPVSGKLFDDTAPGSGAQPGTGSPSGGHVQFERPADGSTPKTGNIWDQPQARPADPFGTAPRVPGGPESGFGGSSPLSQAIGDYTRQGSRNINATLEHMRSATPAQAQAFLDAAKGQPGVSPDVLRVANEVAAGRGGGSGMPVSTEAMLSSSQARGALAEFVTDNPGPPTTTFRGERVSVDDLSQLASDGRYVEEGFGSSTETAARAANLAGDARPGTVPVIKIIEGTPTRLPGSTSYELVTPPGTTFEVVSIRPLTSPPPGVPSSVWHLMVMEAEPYPPYAIHVRQVGMYPP